MRRGGNRRTSQKVEEVVENRTEATVGGRQGGHGPEDRQEVRTIRRASERSEDGAYMAYSPGPVRTGMGGDSRTDRCQSGPGGQNDFRGATAEPSGRVRRRSNANAAAAAEALARHRRTGTGGILRPAIRAGAIGPIVLHAHDGGGNQHRTRTGKQPRRATPKASKASATGCRTRGSWAACRGNTRPTGCPRP